MTVFLLEVMKNINIVVGILFSVLIISCGKSYKERATEKLSMAVNICAKGDSVSALQHLDSIPVLFPEAFETVEKAKEISKKINSEILYRKQDQFDLATQKFSHLEQLFDKEKGEYDRHAQYVPKIQNFERRWNKSFIQLHLDERGELYISSNYSGEQGLNHVGLRVYDGVFQAKTDSIPLDDPNNHRSEFMNTYWEKVSYTQGKDNGVIQFIADHADRNLKAVFLGQRMYFIVLEQFDKQAVKDALALSNALKLRAKLEKEIKELQAKVR
jgi:hypothetical protein